MEDDTDIPYQWGNLKHHLLSDFSLGLISLWNRLDSPAENRVEWGINLDANNLAAVGKK